MSGGCEMTNSNNGVILILALILVVTFLGRGGHVERALASLSIRNGLSRRRTSQHTYHLVYLLHEGSLVDLWDGVRPAVKRFFPFL
jgi:hypothetical protein